MKRFRNTLAERRIALWGRCAWLAYAELVESVPVGVGACYEHPRMADGENMYLVADDFVHDAIGAADFLGHGVEREALGAGDEVKSFKEAA